MSFTELRAFNAVAQHKSFVKAAKSLHRSQPTLTAQITQLEKKHGVELIVRQRGKVTALSPLGEQLYELTRTLVTLEKDAEDLLREAGRLSVGEARIGATAPVIAVRLIKLMEQTHPGVDCQLQFGNSEEVLQNILDGKIDIGILGGKAEYPGCITLPVAKPEIVLVGHKTHPAAQKGSLTREEFAQENLLIREPGSETRELVMEKMQQFCYQPARFIEISRRSGAIAAATASLGLAAVSEHEIEANENLRIIRFSSFRVFGVNHAVCLKSRAKTVVIKALLACSKNLPVAG